MSRTPALALSTTLMIAPGGWALPNDPGSVWGGFLLPMATAWSAIEASMESLVRQVDPRNAVELLPDWEAMLGPDPCGRDLLALSLLDRQKLVYQRYTARGGQSIGYYTALAAGLGVSITIQEATWCRAGMMRAGQRLGRPDGQFDWVVTLPQTRVVLFRAGASAANARLGSFTPNLVQCAIEDASPAHTNVYFSYTGTA